VVNQYIADLIVTKHTFKNFHLLMKRKSRTQHLSLFTGTNWFTIRARYIGDVTSVAAALNMKTGLLTTLWITALSV